MEVSVVIIIIIFSFSCCYLFVFVLLFTPGDPYWARPGLLASREMEGVVFVVCGEGFLPHEDPVWKQRAGKD